MANLKGLEENDVVRSRIIEKVKDISENGGFFQIVNHGISQRVIDGVIDGVRKFHEQDVEVKKEYYTRDIKKTFGHHSNFVLSQAPVAYWRDTLFCVVAPQPPDPEDLPPMCRCVVRSNLHYFFFSDS